MDSGSCSYIQVNSVLDWNNEYAVQISYHSENKGEDFYSFPPSRAFLPTLSLLANTWPEGEQGFIQLKENDTTSLHYIHVSNNVIATISRLKLFSFLKMFRLHLSLLVTCVASNL